MKKIYGSIILKILASIVAIYAVLGFVLFPYLVQLNFTKILKQTTFASGYLERVYINPFTFEVELRNLLIQDEKNKTLLYFDKLFVNIEPSSLLDGIVHIKQIYLYNLKTNIVIDKNNRTNFQYILDFLEKSNTLLDDENQKDKKSTSLYLRLDTIHLKDNRVTFEDYTKSTPFKLDTKKFNINLSNISILPDKKGKLLLDIEIENTARLKMNSDISLNPIQLKGHLSLDNLRINKINSYIKDDINFDLNGERINLDLNYNIKVNSYVTAKITDINTLIYRAEYQKDNISLYLNSVKTKIESIEIIKQDDNISMIVENILFRDGSFKFNDFSKKEPISLSIKNINIKVDEVTLDKNIPIKFSLSLNTPQKGFISTGGKVTIEPLQVDIKLKTKDIVFNPYTPYMKEFVNIDLKSGYLSSDINIKMNQQNNKIEPTIDGDIFVNNLDVFHSLTNKRLFSFKKLSIEKVNYFNNDLNINNIVLDKAYTSFKIAKDKTTNFDNIIVSSFVENNITQDLSNDKKTSNTKSNLKYFIKNIELKDSKTDFSDFSLPLNFATKIDSLKANIKNVSSSDDITNIKLTGLVDKYGMATITGDINPSNFKKQTDININFENLDVASFSPYSGKFIGSKFAKGKLWLDLTYQIRNSNLTSTNNMRIKDLTLGEKVESSDAVDLPIGFVIALLEDSDGFIDVDVPVYGDIDNPEFKLGGAIWGAVGNVITNILTSPFRFLGSLLGMDSDELGSLDFDYGVAILLPSQKEKIDNLINALHKKPNLSLVIHPAYNQIKDLDILRKEKFLKLIDKKDKNSIIKKLFIKKFGEKQYNKIFESKDVENKIEMYSSKLIESMAVINEELKSLAYNRAKSIKQYCLSKKLKKNRIIIDKTIDIFKNTYLKRITMNLDVDIKKKEEL